MPSSNSNHSGPYAPNANENVELSYALKQQIKECFEEGIQAIQLEHKSAERWMTGLKQEMQKATGEIVASCQRVEADMLQCHELLNDVKTHSTQPERFQNVFAHKATQELAQKTLGHAGGESLSTTVNEYAEEEAQAAEDKPNSATHIHSQMLDKIESDEKKWAEITRIVEKYCSCYHDKCVPRVVIEFVHSDEFNNLCALITVAFAIAVGIEADLAIRAALDGKNDPTWIGHLIKAFNVWFIAEVTLRILIDGVHYFLDIDWRWNVFDLVIVMFSLGDMIGNLGSFGFLRILRALKVAKALRVVRLLRMFRDLRLLIASMLTSLMSLIWSMIILVMVIYIAAATLVEAAAFYVKNDSNNAGVDEIRKLYSSLPDAMYTLFMSITGGIDWSDAALPVWDIGWFYGALFMGYILFSLLAILNVITSIFVERAQNMKKHDRDYAVSEELRTMEEDIEATMGLFQTLTKNGVREIEVEHLKEILGDKKVIAHFASIGIEITDRTFITHVLGSDDAGGLVNTRAFVRGCFSLRGAAKQSDTFAIIAHVKRVERVLEKILQEGARNLMMLTQLTVKSGYAEEDKERDLYAIVKDSHPHVPPSSDTENMLSGDLQASLRSTWKI